MEALRHIKNKYYFYSIWRRINSLWNDYKALADDGQNFKEAQAKLHEFLDSFQIYYDELVKGGYLDKESLDKIYGDMGDVLVDIIDTVEREAEKDENIQVMQQFINKALGVAELILHDEKYILIVKETPNLMNRILCLLDSLKTVENKKLLLRVIANLSKDFENKLEIGRLDGFRKILLLLVENDKELTTEIVKTLKHFLDEISIYTGDDDVEEVKKVIDIVNEKKPSIRSLAGTRIKSVLSEVSNVLVKFTSRVQEMVQEDEDLDPVVLEKPDKHAFIPSKEEIAKAIEELHFNDIQLLPNDQGKEHETSRPEDAPRSGLEESTREQTILKEFMRVQGALSTLTESIQEAALTIQLDLLETISKLLFKSQTNQAEFRKINGYYFLIRIFDTIPDLSSEESHLFLEQSFNLLYPICLDGNVNKRVGNPDALLLLFRIISGSSHAQVRLHAISCIQDIISANPLNVVDIFHIDGLNYLASALRTENMDQMDQTDDKKQFYAAVINLLQYIGVIASKHNLSVLQLYLDLIDFSASGIKDPTMRCHILKSLFSILSDHLYRDNTLLLEDSLQIALALIKPLKYYVRKLLPTNTYTIETGEYQGHDDEVFDMELEYNKGASNIELDTVHNIEDCNDDLFIGLDSCPKYEKPDPMLPEQVILLLESLGLLLRRVPEIYEDFFSDRNCTITTFVSLISIASDPKASIPVEIIDLVLWILNEVTLIDTRYSKRSSDFLLWMIELLDFSKNVVSNEIKVKLCNSITELIQELRSTTIANITASTQRALLLLCDILKNEKDKDVLSAAWQTFGQIILESEPNKTFIGRKIGYETFSEIVINSGVLTDRESFEVILELSCYGLSQIAQRVTYTSNMDNIVHMITRPQPLFTKLLDPHSDSSVTHATTTADSISEDDEFSSPELAFMSPYPKSAGQVKQPNFRYIKTSSLESLPVLDLKNGTSSTTSNSMNSASTSTTQISTDIAVSLTEVAIMFGKLNYGDRTKLNGTGSMRDDGRLTALSSYRRLAKVQVRNSDVTPLLLKTLVALNVELQKEILKLLLAICQSNEANKKVLSNGSALVRLIEIVKDGCHPDVQSYYLKLMVLLGLYDVTPGEVKLLMDLASAPVEPGKEQLQKLMLYVLASIAERVVPPTFFSFSGLSGHFRLGMLERFPNSKVGYTLSCWVKLNAFPNPEEGLLSWNNHQNNETIFDLYFKTFSTPTHRPKDTFSDNDEPGIQGEDISTEEEICLLCVQTQDPPTPAESFSFDKYNFSSWGSWHHVVLTHCKQEVVLFVDGQYIQSCTSLNYPRTVTKDKALTGYIGRRGSSKDTHFSGQIGTIYFLNGVWDKEMVKKVYHRGTFWDLTSFAAEIGTIAFLTIRPEAYLINEERRDYLSLPIKDSVATTPVVKSLEFKIESPPLVQGDFESISEFNPLMGSIQDTVFPPGVVAHHTKVLQNVIKEVGGIKTCFYLLEVHPEQQVPVLRIIAGLLCKCPENMAKFEKQDGYNILLHILRRNYKYIAYETFDILFDLLCDTHEVTKQINKFDPTFQQGVKCLNRNILSILLQLLIECCHFMHLPQLHPDTIMVQDSNQEYTTKQAQEDMQESIKHALHTLHILFIQNETNITFFLTNEQNEPELSNFFSLLELFARSARATMSCQLLQRILNSLLPHLHPRHIEILFNTIIGSNIEDFPIKESKEDKHLLEEQQEYMKACLVQEIFNQMTKQPQLVEHLRNFGSGEGGGFRALLTLLKSTEVTRILALKMIGLLLERNKTSTAYFHKNSGFQMISLLLAPFPVTLAMGRTLIGLGLDEYRCNGAKQQGYISWGMSFFTGGEEDQVTTSKNRIIHPEAIHVLFELIKFADDEGLKTAALIEVSDRLLTEQENIEILWDRCNWLDWCLSFLGDEEKRGEGAEDGFSMDEEDEVEASCQSHSHNTLRQLGVIIKKMMVYEICRKSSRIFKLKEIENEQFQGHVIELIIDHFDKNPKLPRDTAAIIIDNLVALFKHVKGLKILPRVYVRILDVIATLTVHNTAEIRAIMNKQRLYTFRNDIVIFLLQSYKSEPEYTRYLIENFEFQSIASHDEFRESLGIHHLVQLFHETRQFSEYQVRIFYVLKKVIGCIENKIVLKDIFDNDTIFKNFFGKMTPEDFITWYFEQTQAITIIESTLKKAISPHEAKFKAFQQKMVQEQQNRQKNSKMRRNSTTKWSNFATMEQKRKRDEKTARDATIAFLQSTREHTHEKEKKGSEKWNTFHRKIIEKQQKEIL